MNISLYVDESFYLTALHEIGHAIGLGHSIENTSIMFPYSFNPPGIYDLNTYDQNSDVINAVQFLYGLPIEHTTSSGTTSTTTTTTTPMTIPMSNPPIVKTTSGTDIELSSLDISFFRNEFNHFLVFKDKLYVLHNTLVWILSVDQALRTPGEYTNPKLIKNLLTFLPKGFKNITAIYQRPNDEIAIVIDQCIYNVQTPYLNLIKKPRLEMLVGRSFSNLNAVISTNQEKTFFFNDDWYVVEIKECSYSGSLLGTVSRTFPGIPGTLNGSFRYINGKLYFLTNKN